MNPVSHMTALSTGVWGSIKSCIIYMGKFASFLTIHPRRIIGHLKLPYWESNFHITCVNSVIEISLIQQCKIFQYKYLWQYSMNFWDFFSLDHIQQPAWLQLDHRKLGPSRMWLLRPLYHKTEKHSFKCDILLWKTLIRVSIEF